MRTPSLRVAIARLVVPLLVIVGAVTAVPAAAQAIEGCPTIGRNHCWAQGRLNQYDNLHAVGTDLWVDCLHVDNRDTDFIDMEMWLSTRVNEPGFTWVESGMTAGELMGHGTGFMWFWADSYATSGAYYEHYIGPALTGNWTNVSFYWEGNNWWGVYNAGWRVGGSAVGPYPGAVSVGAESTTPRAAVKGWAKDWQYLDRAETGWRTVSAPEPIINGSAAILNASVSSGGVYAWTPRRACGAPPPAIAGPGAGPRQSLTTTPAATLAITPASLATILTTRAHRLAAANGDSKPTAMRYLASTRKTAALTVSSAQVNTDQNVYVVEMTGSFSKTALHGTAKISGGSMTVIVDAATGQVTDWGITRAPGGISALGVATAL